MEGRVALAFFAYAAANPAVAGAQRNSIALQIGLQVLGEFYSAETALAAFDAYLHDLFPVSAAGPA